MHTSLLRGKDQRKGQCGYAMHPRGVTVTSWLCATEWQAGEPELWDGSQRAQSGEVPPLRGKHFSATTEVAEPVLSSPSTA